MPESVYCQRNPQDSPYYQCVEDHFETFELIYDERFEWQYGFFRPYFKQVICRYLDYGVLKNGFARVRCEECGHEYLLGHSCKRRHFNPLSSTRLKTALLYPVIIHLCRGRFRLQPFSHKIQCRQLCLQVLASDRHNIDHVKADSKQNLVEAGAAIRRPVTCAASATNTDNRFVFNTFLSLRVCADSSNFFKKCKQAFAQVGKVDR